MTNEEVRQDLAAMSAEPRQPLTDAQRAMYGIGEWADAEVRHEEGRQDNEPQHSRHTAEVA